MVWECFNLLQAGSIPCNVADDQVTKLVSAIELGPQWLDEVFTIISLKDEKEKIKRERQLVQEKLRRMAKAFIDGLIDEEEYNRQRRLYELKLESLIIPGANAAEEAGKLLLDLPRLWEIASPEEQGKLLVTMLDAVYVDAKKTKSIVAVKPKPPFRPVFQVAAQREQSVIHIINGLEDKSPSPALFLVETGES